jgi:hypothetical protein
MITPRTDAERRRLKKSKAYPPDPVSADFARTLERELAEYERTEPLKLAERNGLLRELAEYQSRDGTCDWAENQDGAYETSCGEIFEFTNGGPKDNKFTHCPYCGKELDTPNTPAHEPRKEKHDN